MVELMLVELMLVGTAAALALAVAGSCRHEGQP
jgi:hypothetical protein